MLILCNLLEMFVTEHDPCSVSLALSTNTQLNFYLNALSRMLFHAVEQLLMPMAMMTTTTMDCTTQPNQIKSKRKSFKNTRY